MTTTMRPPRTPVTPPKRTPWFRRPWIIPLALIAATFLVASVPRYLSLDPTRSFIEPPADFPPYYGFLVAHVMFATVAMVTCCMQIWPWLRQRHPRVHRTSGRIYVIAGVIPAGISALVLAWGSAFGPTGSASTFIMAPLWIAMTVTGFLMARRRRFAEHRRWMVRSFALTMSIVANRFIGIPLAFAMYEKKDTLYHGDELLVAHAAGGITSWVGWVVCLLIAEWWLVERRTPAQRLAREARRG